MSTPLPGLDMFNTLMRMMQEGASAPDGNPHDALSFVPGEGCVMLETYLRVVQEMQRLESIGETCWQEAVAWFDCCRREEIQRQ